MKTADIHSQLQALISSCIDEGDYDPAEDYIKDPFCRRTMHAASLAIEEIDALRARVAELEDQHRETVPPRLLAIEDQSLAACRGCVDEAVGIAERFAESGVRDKLIAAQFIYTLAGILSARAANGGEA